MTGALVAVAREGLLLALWLAAPVLIAALVAGVVTAVLGAVTQLQDAAIGLALRVVAVGGALVVFAPSIGHQLDAFTARLWPLIATIGGG